MFGCTTISRLRKDVATYVAAFDASAITAHEAVVVVGEAARIEKMAATLKSLAAARADEASVLGADGDASAAHALARRSGTTVGKAAEALRTGKRLAAQPALDAAARRGDVSPEQAAAISDAAAADPAAEAWLVETAERASLSELRNECERVKAAADRDDEERHRRIHAARAARRRSCPDGSAEISYRSTRDEVAEVWAVICGFANQAFHRARQSGAHESSEAYAADGVVAMARAAGHAGSAGPDVPTTADGAGADAPTTADGAGADVPATADGAGPDVPATADGAGPDVPTTADGAGADAPATADGAGADAPATADGAGPDVPATADGNGAKPDAPTAADGANAPAPEHSRAAEDPDQREPEVVGAVVGVGAAAPAGVDPDGAAPASSNGVPGAPGVCDGVLPGLGLVAPGPAPPATKGVDVVSVAHLGRKATAHQQSALDWLAPTCRVTGCDVTARLETDHRVDWADTHMTLLEWLDRLCECHHDKKTYDGWALVAGTGKRPMVPPDDPRHPRHHAD